MNRVPESRADWLQMLAPILREQVEHDRQQLQHALDDIERSTQAAARLRLMIDRGVQALADLDAELLDLRAGSGVDKGVGHPSPGGLQPGPERAADFRGCKSGTSRPEAV